MFLAEGPRTKTLASSGLRASGPLRAGVDQAALLPTGSFLYFSPVVYPRAERTVHCGGRGPADQGPRSSRSAEAKAPSLHRAPVARLLRFFSLLSSLQRPHKGKKETKKTTTGG